MYVTSNIQRRFGYLSVQMTGLHASLHNIISGCFQILINMMISFISHLPISMQT